MVLLSNAIDFDPTSHQLDITNGLLLLLLFSNTSIVCIQRMCARVRALFVCAFSSMTHNYYYQSKSMYRRKFIITFFFIFVLVFFSLILIFVVFCYEFCFLFLLTSLCLTNSAYERNPIHTSAVTAIIVVDIYFCLWMIKETLMVRYVSNTTKAITVPMSTASAHRLSANKCLFFFFKYSKSKSFTLWPVKIGFLLHTFYQLNACD